jgi:UDP-glucose 4-epimerase
MDEPGLCHRVNAGGTVHVLEAARLRHVPRVVFSSSAAVYGEADSFPLSEDAPGLPISPYGLHKLIGEQYGRMYSRLGWTQVVSLRYFNVFGPRQDPNSDYAAVIPKFITAVRKGLPPAIFGDGTQSRDFVFVDDVARVNVLAMQSPALLPGSYNVCTGAEWSLLDLVGELSRCAGREVVPHFEPARPGDIRRSVGSPAKLHDALGFSPPSALGPGLAATWQWYRDEPAA